MRVLWVNPSFLDYRIPLYSEMKERCSDNFYLLYSKGRIPERCHSRIQQELGDKAAYIDKEALLGKGSTAEFSNKGILVPLPQGLYRKIKKINPDLLISEGFFQFTPWSLIYAWLHHKPLLIAYERTAHTERNCPLWRKLYRRFVGLFVDGYIVNGTLTKEYLISQGVKGETVFTGAMCADSDALAMRRSRLSDVEIKKLRNDLFGGKFSGVVFVSVGQMIPRKGVRQLIAGWIKHIAQYPNDRLLLIGEGRELEAYRKEVDTINSIIFTGAINYDEIHRYYAVSDVFVMPTLEDNWSLVVPEAMSCGLPVACSIYNGCHPELVHENVNGITFDPLDDTSVSNALNYFHTVDLQKLGEASRMIEANYNPRKVAGNIMNAVNSFVG